MTVRLDDRRLRAAALGQWIEAGVLTTSDAMVAASCAELAAEDDPWVILALALAVRIPRSGHVALDLRAIRDQVLGEMEHVDPDVVARARDLPWPTDTESWFNTVANSPLATAVGAPLAVDLGLVYLASFYRHEVAVAERIGALASVDSPAGARLDDIAAVLELDVGQHAAVQRCLGGRLGVLTGGPGTGKTRTVAALLAALLAGAEHDLRIGLAAPTGKAAARMAESIDSSVALLRESGDQQLAAIGESIGQLAPSTIHRLLGVRPGGARFKHTARHLLPHDVVVIDEASMVSLPMMDALLSALDPTAQLILVGDAGQLASVDAGSVLGDIASATGVVAHRVAELTESRRFPSTSRIGQFAVAIRAGDSAAAETILNSGPTGADDGVILARVDSVGDVAPDIAEHLNSVVPPARQGDAASAVAALDSLRVLCAHRRGRAGVAHWNRVVEDMIVASGHSIAGMYPGRPLMITRNDPGRRLYNGDVGVVVRTEAGPKVAFPDEPEPRLLAPSHLDGTETVHALTIHKSQGSEFDHVIVVLPSADSRLATRELLYTAVTRAKRRVTLVGGTATVVAAITRTTSRTSGLAQRLGAERREFGFERGRIRIGDDFDAPLPDGRFPQS